MKEEEAFDPAELAGGHEDDEANAKPRADEGDEADAKLGPGEDEKVDVAPEESPKQQPENPRLQQEPAAQPEADGGDNRGEVYPSYEDLAVDCEKGVPFETLLARMKKRPKEVKLVLLLGYPTAGKTWFLQRLKWIYLKDKYSPWDRHVLEPPVVDDGHPVERTDKPATHLFDFQPINSVSQPDLGRERRTFVVADLPGELFDRATMPQGGFSRVTDRTEVTSLLKIADALIMMLPAEEVLLGTGGIAQGDELPTNRLPALQKEIEALEENLKVAQTAARKRRQTKAERAVRQGDVQAIEAQLRAKRAEYAGVARLRLKQFLEDFIKLGKLVKDDPSRRDNPLPVFVALSRADQIISDEKPYDKDPWGELFKAQPELADHLQKDYLWSRVDFVTAFEGQPRDEAVVHYEKHRYFGVDAVLNWIDWATKRTLPTGPRSRLGLTRALRLTRQKWVSQQGGAGRV